MLLFLSFSAAFRPPFLPFFGNMMLPSPGSPILADICIAVKSWLKQMRTGICESFAATLLLSKILPDPSTVTRIVVCGTVGVTRTVNSSSDILLKSSIVFISFSLFRSRRSAFY